MELLDDVARSGADDDPRVVAASFACPLCLGLETEARLVIVPDDSEVECACPVCGADWRVAVDAAQVMRLVLHPPAAEADAPLRMLPVRTADASRSQRYTA